MFFFIYPHLCSEVDLTLYPGSTSGLPNPYYSPQSLLFGCAKTAIPKVLASSMMCPIHGKSV